MSTVNIKITATPSEGLKAYWVAVDDQDVKLVDGVGAVNIEASAQHILSWWLMGNPGESMGILGQVSGQAVVQVQRSGIPAGRVRGGGCKPFAVA